MKCTNCGENSASFHYKSNVNGKVTELHLCADCAKELGYIGNTPNTNDYFSSMLQGFFGQSPVLRTELRCPLCGATARDIEKTGKVGCASCYSTFSELLDPYIRRIHGACEHNGKLPKSADVKHRARRELKKLQKELDEAVDRQDFERAVILRDKIKEYREVSGNE